MNEDEQQQQDEAAPPNPELDEAKARIATLEKAAQDAAPLIAAGLAARRAEFTKRVMGRGSVKDDSRAVFDVVVATKIAESAIDLATASEAELSALAESIAPLVRPLMTFPTANPPPGGSGTEHPYSRIPRDF